MKQADRLCLVSCADIVLLKDIQALVEICFACDSTCRHPVLPVAVLTRLFNLARYIPLAEKSERLL